MYLPIRRRLIKESSLNTSISQGLLSLDLVYGGIIYERLAYMRWYTRSDSEWHIHILYFFVLICVHSLR